MASKESTVGWGGREEGSLEADWVPGGEDSIGNETWSCAAVGYGDLMVLVVVCGLIAA